ncbi:protein kinase [Trypanosoma rangeli]|uniref:non-specific serine/threonine protein kinase n=1 Tax=Trypanosoma rangeli TaxID=5698 RepID=A0A3R7NLI6_TRYRA|nr:protein kinase [Trypanosoma rangeli]RNF04415.1 protein kinase [Trypanosoma rangeli]|eukprot:RNF04415.1 protein kinase [Trypanosoma rangeli]
MQQQADIFDGQYRVIKLLGRGAFGDAFLVKEIGDDSLLVLKCSKMVQNDGRILDEANNMLLTSNDHVLRCYRSWIEPAHKRCCMLLEYCDGGDLEDYLGLAFPFSESQLISMFAQLLMGLEHVHLKHLIHRDIKLQNLMFQRSTGMVKIGDFGLSKALQFTDEVSVTRLGTPLYFSPEVVSGLEYTRKTDVWSMGVAFYRLMTNALPFPATSVEEIYEYLVKKRAVHPCRLREGYYSECLGDMVMKMLTKSRTKRPTARELLSLPLFAPVLCSWPWHPPRLKGTSCLFVCRPQSCVNVRSQPSLSSERIGVFEYGDQIFVDTERVSAGGTTWHRVLYPLEGYCITATNGGLHLFQRIDDPARCSPIPQ